MKRVILVLFLASTAFAGRVNLLAGFKVSYKRGVDKHFKKLEVYDFKVLLNDKESESQEDLRWNESIYYTSDDQESKKSIAFFNGKCEQSIKLEPAPHNTTFVLQYIDVTNYNDHHIKDFKVLERDNKLYIDFCDRHRNTGVYGQVHYAWVSKDVVSGKQTTKWEEATTYDRQHLIESPIALAGFHFRYTGKKDHHIERFGINGNFSQTGKPDIWFGDASKNKWEYFIDYVYIL